MKELVSINHESPEVIKKPFNPRLAFRTAFYDELHEEYKQELDGVSYDDVREAAGSRELMEKIQLLFTKASEIHDNFYKTEISKLGKSQYAHGGFWNKSIKTIQKSLSTETPSYTEDDIEEDLSKFFELYVCIRSQNPDLIITLPNGASRLNAVAESLGFNADNFLIIHRNTDDENRSDYKLSPEITYEGSEINTGSKVLILEDTSDFAAETTYKIAQNWLKERGVTNSSVFFEYVGTISRISYFPDRENEGIDLQNRLYDEGLFNSLATDRIDKKSDFWSKSKNKIVELCEKHSEIYHDFFEHIRNTK